jgi:hypothetical protein
MKVQSRRRAPLHLSQKDVMRQWTCDVKLVQGTATRPLNLWLVLVSSLEIQHDGSIEDTADINQTFPL